MARDPKRIMGGETAAYTSVKSYRQARWFGFCGLYGSVYGVLCVFVSCACLWFALLSIVFVSRGPFLGEESRSSFGVMSFYIVSYYYSIVWTFLGF